MKPITVYLLATFFLMIGVAASGYGAYATYMQHQTIANGIAVDALVVESKVDMLPLRFFSEYEPKVTFWYEYEGKNHSVDGPAPTTLYTSQSWANQIIKQFPLGAKATAYVNPHSPANAYLYKHYGSFPYAMCLAGILCLLASAAVWREHRLAIRRIDPPASCDDGWYRLAPPPDRRHAAGVTIAAGIVVELLGLPVWAHYWWVAQPPTGVLFILCVIAFHVFGYAVIIYGAYQFSVANKYDEAAIYVSSAEPVVGEFVDVQVEQVIRVAGVVESLAVTILCVEMQSLWAQMRKQDDEVRIFEHTETALQGTKIDAGEKLIADFEFVVPEVVPPSTLSQTRGGKLVKWRLEVKTQIRDQSGYKCKTPIVVREAASLLDAGIVLA